MGATVFLPVFVPGALFSVATGTGHKGTARLTGPLSRPAWSGWCSSSGWSRVGLKRPRAETDPHPIFLAFGEDLDATGYPTVRRGLTRHEVYSLASIAADFRISQVVNGPKGVHAMLPKTLFGGGAS